MGCAVHGTDTTGLRGQYKHCFVVSEWNLGRECLCAAFEAGDLTTMEHAALLVPVLLASVEARLARIEEALAEARKAGG